MTSLWLWIPFAYLSGLLTPFGVGVYIMRRPKLIQAFMARMTAQALRGMARQSGK